VIRVLATTGLTIALLSSLAAVRADLPAYVFTAAPRYDSHAWNQGGERFPGGARLLLVSGQGRRELAPGFFASADAAVSWDATKVAFAGKRRATDRWQIWETTLSGGAPRHVAAVDADCIRPLYLPDGRVVYTRVSRLGSTIEVTAESGRQERLSYAPGWFLTADVLRDGRILFESAGELFTVYPDGTGVESLRCDHGPWRSGARQVFSGDVVFNVAGRFARFTSARAEQVEVAQPDRESEGPIAEVSPANWMVSLRRAPGNFGIYLWDRASGQLREIEAPASAHAVEPVVVAARVPARQFPSALVPTRTTGNLLCLNARESKSPLPGKVQSVRLYSRNAAGNPVVLGQTAIEPDGSFYVEVPADRPLRVELIDKSGAVIRAAKNWFWMRPSEQRICVGCHVGPERSPENRVPGILNRTLVPVPMLGDYGHTQ
jgi:hypothetical protein